jgi:hypothetical protein
VCRPHLTTDQMCHPQGEKYESARYMSVDVLYFWTAKECVSVSIWHLLINQVIKFSFAPLRSACVGNPCWPLALAGPGCQPAAC